MLKRKLLLADDSITIQKVVNLTFADEGIQVISVGDGDSAMDKVREDAPDLILADVNMPGLSGYQICERIKQTPATQKIPVILLVGSFEPFDEAEAYRVGADDYLTKPFQSIRQLVTKVSDLLEATGSGETEAPETIENPETESDAANIHFFNTVEIPLETKAAPTKQFADAELDDELIQTDQIGSLPVDDIQKFIAESTAGIEDAPTAPAMQSSGFDFYQNIEPEDDFAKTEPLNIEDLRSFSSESVAAQTVETNGATVYEIFPDETQFTESEPEKVVPENQEIAPRAEFAADEKFAENEGAATSEFEYFSGQTVSTDEQNSVEDEKTTDSDLNAYAASAQVESQTSAFSQPQFSAAPEFSFDDSDLLDLPPIETRAKAAHQIADEFSTEQQQDEVDLPQAASSIEEAEEFENHLARSEQDVQIEQESASANEAEAEIDRQIAALPPELIEAITRRVAEKMSDKAIREIAWEVVPQMTDLIVRRMAEEKFKE